MCRYLMGILIFLILYPCNSDKTRQIKRNSGQDSSVKKILAKVSDTPSLKKLGLYTIEGDSLLVQPFEIEISLSPKAKERIVNTGETIIIDILLDGVPKDSSKSNLAEDGSFYVGSAIKEI